MPVRPLQRKIHAACRQLGLDAEARHDLQLNLTGKASMRDMEEAELQQVLAHLQASGAKIGTSGGGHKAASRADLRLIHVLWRKLGEAGALERPGRDGLNAFIRARFGDTWRSVPADVDMLRHHEQIDAVIAALKDWGRREGIDFDFSRTRRAGR